jgi:hypothetical protein
MSKSTKTPKAPKAPKGKSAKKGTKGMKKGGMMMMKGGGMMKKGGTPAPTSGPTSTPSTTIADFIISEPDLSIIFFALQRVNNVTLSQEDLLFIFDNEIPFTGPLGRKLAFVQNNPLRRNNLVEILDEPGDFTFFAPTNNAFKAIGRDLLAKLFLIDEFRPLWKILSFIMALLESASLMTLSIMSSFRHSTLRTFWSKRVLCVSTRTLLLCPTATLPTGSRTSFVESYNPTGFLTQSLVSYR